MTENKRFFLEDGDYDLKYEFRIADLSRVKKTKEDFWHEKGFFMYSEFITYLYGYNAFLTKDEADNILNGLVNENKQLKSQNEYIIGQIKAFRDDCYTATDFTGVSTLNRLIEILENGKELFDDRE